MRLFFYFLLIISFSFFLVSAVRTGKALYEYTTYSNKIFANLSSVEIREGKQFFVVGVFQLQNGMQIRADILGPFPNRYVAEEEMKRVKYGPYEIWTKESEEGSHAILKKVFPMKSLISTLIMLGIFIYFVVLKKRSNV